MTSKELGYWNELRAQPFPDNYPTADVAQRLYDEMLFQRTCQVVLWAMPAMSVYAMKKGSEKIFGAPLLKIVTPKNRLN